MAVDMLSLISALVSGVFMGTFPVPVKVHAVLEAQAHPIVFQCYKSFWVFAFGLVFVSGHLLQAGKLIFEFTWWGVFSAAAWVPAGICVISAVPELGVGVTMVVMAGVSSTLTFLVFWLGFGERMALHGPPGARYPLAPLYLFCALLGMAGVVFASAPRQQYLAGDRGRDTLLDDHQVKGVEVGARHSSRFFSFLVAGMSGVLCSLQYGIVSVGRLWSEEAEGCEMSPARCTGELRERFNSLGSWTTSFGIGAGLVTSCYATALIAARSWRGRSAVQFHFRTLSVPGSISGICWVMGNLLQTWAVMRGGQAVIIPAAMAARLVVSSAWGILYYHELSLCSDTILWIFAVLWTLVSIVLLSLEQVQT